MKNIQETCATSFQMLLYDSQSNTHEVRSLYAIV